jgi:hypothetical protein
MVIRIGLITIAEFGINKKEECNGNKDNSRN